MYQRSDSMPDPVEDPVVLAPSGISCAISGESGTVVSIAPDAPISGKTIEFSVPVEVSHDSAFSSRNANKMDQDWGPDHSMNITNIPGAEHWTAAISLVLFLSTILSIWRFAILLVFLHRYN